MFVLVRVLVLGGYGLIGSAVCRRLEDAGCEVVGLGRNPALGRQRQPSIPWVGVDIAALNSAAAWSSYLEGIECVVNAAGALQDGARDDLDALQNKAIVACVAACEAAGVKRFVQISAPGAHPDASTDFLRTKAAGDEAIRQSTLDWTILKPGLVIARDAYGGTALLRMLAGFPGAAPVVEARAPVMTAFIDDVADAVLVAARGQAPMRRDYDFVADETLTLGGVLSQFRRWLGYDPQGRIWRAPLGAGALAAVASDAAGYLGWRSPLRSTALKVMREGVIADPADGPALLGRPLKRLEDSLAAMPAGAQERLYARFQLLLPLFIVGLATFWIATGVIALFQLDQSAVYISGPQGVPLARILIALGAFADIAIGLALLIKPTARGASLAAVLLTALYLFAGTVFAPSLWINPLGPFLKAAITALPALALWLMLEER